LTLRSSTAARGDRWFNDRERETIAYLIEENCLLRRQLGGRRLRLTDDDRRRPPSGLVYFSVEK
jgi:hypothetical protein